MEERKRLKCQNKRYKDREDGVHVYHAHVCPVLYGLQQSNSQIRHMSVREFVFALQRMLLNSREAEAAL